MVLGGEIVLRFVQELFEGLDPFVAGGEFSFCYCDFFFEGRVLFDQLARGLAVKWI